MQFRILGSMEVLDGTRRVHLPAGRGRALLALLVLHAGEAVSAERLIDELWGEHPPATAHTVVQVHVSRLRKQLEPSRGRGRPSALLQTVGRGYRLAVGPDQVDADRFKGLLDRSRGATPEVRSAVLGEALALWHGPPLADFTYEPFAQRAIAALSELRLVAIEDRLEAELALGRAGELVAELGEATEEHPFRERLRGLLMVALYRAGRQADALQAYRDARAALVDGLGIEPGPALRDLQQAILRQDRSLELQPRPRPKQLGERVARGWLPRERRTLTVAVVDLTPRPAEPGMDPEARGRLAARTTAVAGKVLRRHGARVEQHLGDLLIGFFGFPVANEDDPVRAVRAAVELRAAVQALNTELPKEGVRYAARVAIETGEVVIGGSSASLRDVVSGQVVTAAGRLQQAGGDGEVIVGAATQRLVRGAVVLKPAHELAAEPGGVAAWKVLDVLPGAPAVPRSLDSPMVGRQAELSRLRTAFRRTARTGTATLFMLAGEAGIGKSRLAKEFTESIGSNVKVISGRCPAYGNGITFLPLRQAVLEAAGPRGWPAIPELLAAEDDGAQVAEEIAAAIGLTPKAGNVPALFAAVRRLFQMLAAEGPLVVVLEDLHWAEPTFLDLVEDLAGTARGPVFVLCLARPELLERRPGWQAAPTVLLEPLPASEIEELLVDRAGTVSPELLDRIVAAARGNPLFAEQLLAALDDATVDAVPASLHGLLTMRLDRLGPGERDVLRCAAVVGPEFSRDALLALLPDQAHRFVDRHLGELERTQLLIQVSQGAFRFLHVLIQLAAYQSMTRQDRAHLHERFGDWLETDSPDPPAELDGIVGYHLEQAVQHQRATAVDGAGGAALAVRAGERLGNAAERALARLDQTAAENLMARARSMLPPDHPRRPGLTQRLAEVRLVLGRFSQAQELLGELMQAAAAAGDRSSELAARLEHARVRFIIGPDPVPLAAIRRQAEEAARRYAEAGDESGRQRASFLLGCARLRAGEVGQAEEAFRESLALADRTGQLRERLATRWLLGMALAAGPTPVTTCIQECEALTATLESEHPGLLTELAVLSAMQGRHQEARRLQQHARHSFLEQMRARRMLMFLAQSRATVERLAGDLAAAEGELRTWLALAREFGERDQISQSAARLALLLRRLGRPGEVAELALLSAEAAPVDGTQAQALSRAAMAASASAAGQHQQAERLAREAVGWIPDEMLHLRADVLAELAEVLIAAGRQQSAERASSEAVRLYTLKGNIVSAEQVPPLRRS
jgi:DNA-binding SARP family transcriptional activator/tetratricopeptide (TPR) repeat protein